MSDLKARCDELIRLRDAATQGEWTNHGCAVSGPFTPKGQAKLGIIADARNAGGIEKATANARFIAYAANHAVEIAEAALSLTETTSTKEGR